MAEENEQEPYEDPRSKYIDVPEVRKTYLLTDKLETQLPAEFVFSDNKRYIEVQNVKFYDCNKKDYPEDAFMHVNFIYDKPYLNGCVGPVNHIATKYKLYPFKSNDDTLKLRFSKMESSQVHSEDATTLFRNFDSTTAWEPMKSSIVPDYRVIAELFKATFTKDLYNVYQSLSNVPDAATTNAMKTIKEVFIRLKSEFKEYFANPNRKSILDYYEEYYKKNFKTDSFRWQYQLFLQIIIWYIDKVSSNYYNHDVLMFPFRLFDLLPQGFNHFKKLLGFGATKTKFTIVAMFLPMFYFGNGTIFPVELMETVLKELEAGELLSHITPRHEEAAIVFIHYMLWHSQVFHLTEEDIDMLKATGTLYINYGQFVPEQYQNYVREMLSSIQFKLFDYDRACIDCNFFDDEVLNPEHFKYSNYGFPIAPELMFYHCCQILSGRKQEPILFHNVEWNGAGVKQVARDTLSSCNFVRILKYIRRYTKKKTPVVVSTGKDYVLPMNNTTKFTKYDVFCDFAYNFNFTSLFRQFSNKEAMSQETNSIYNLARKDFNSDLQAAINASDSNINFTRFIGPSLQKLTSSNIMSELHCVYTFLIVMLQFLSDNLADVAKNGYTSWKNAISVFVNVWHLNTESGILALIEHWYNEGKYVSYYTTDPGSKDKPFYNQIVGALMGKLDHESFECFLKNHNGMGSVEQYTTFLSRIEDKYPSYEGLKDEDFYAFYTRFYGAIDYFIEVDDLIFDDVQNFACLFDVALACHKQKSLKAIMKVASELEGFEPNFDVGPDTFDGKDLYYYALFLEMAHYMGGTDIIPKDKLAFDLINTSTDENGNEVETYQVMIKLISNPNTYFTLTYNKIQDIDDVPDEQIELDEHGKEKYNYRFMAEFMLVY